MDGNVVFNGNSTDQEQQDQANPQSPTGTPAAVGEQPTADATSTTGDTGGVGTESPPPDDTVPEEPASQSAGGNGLLKKILIGVGILAVIILLIFLFLPKKETSKNVKLVWWGLWEENATMQALISDFEKENPTILVEYIKQDPKQYRDRLISRINNDTGPDIFRFHNTWLPIMQDMLVPLSSDVISAADFKKTYYPVMQDDLVRKGAIYGIPLGTDSLALFVNTELLESAGVPPPTNWDDFTKAAKKMTVKDEQGEIKTSGAAIGVYGNITHAPDIISVLFKQQGINLLDLDTSLDAEIEALTFYTGFGADDQRVWDSRLDESLLAFSKGTVAMYFGYSWDVFRLQRLNANLPFAVHPVPGLYGKNTTIASYWVEGVSARSANQKEALLFMQYLAKKETAQKFYSEAAKARGFGEPPARIDLADSVKDNKIVAPFVAQMETADSSFFVSDTQDGEGGLNSLANTYLGDAVNAIVNDGTSPKSVMTSFNGGVAQTLQKYDISATSNP
ncbi:MAG: extracellular solute-binding protein [Patescibacteria group bacterium]